MLKRSSIEAVSDRLSVALRHLIEAAEADDSTSAKQGSSGTNKTSSLHPSLKVRVCFCLVPQLYFNVL